MQKQNFEKTVKKVPRGQVSRKKGEKGYRQAVSFPYANPKSTTLFLHSEVDHITTIGFLACAMSEKRGNVNNVLPSNQDISKLPMLKMIIKRV